MGKHTILLVQTRGKSSRTYYDFDNEGAAVAGARGACINSRGQQGGRGSRAAGAADRVVRLQAPPPGVRDRVRVFGASLKASCTPPTHCTAPHSTHRSRSYHRHV